MTEISPKVAIESPVLRVPIFANKALFASCRSIPSITTASSLTSISYAQRSSMVIQGRSLSEKSYSSCKCPHVLIADDDPFQKFYYLALFQRSIEFNSLNIDKESFRVKVVKSGEELLRKYFKSQACGCRTLMLIITDYNMGEQNINGVQVAIHLRKLGYKGPIFLRTGETREELAVNHKDFQVMLLGQKINCVLDKTNHLETKNRIQEILKKKVGV